MATRAFPGGSVWLTMSFGVVLACGSERPSPRIDAIEPGEVHARESTPAALFGANFFNRVSVETASSAPPEIGGGWAVFIGTDRVAATGVHRVDARRIELVVPRGLPVGVHEVRLNAPDGRHATLPKGLTVRDDRGSADGGAPPTRPTQDGGTTPRDARNPARDAAADGSVGQTSDGSVADARVARDSALIDEAGSDASNVSLGDSSPPPDAMTDARGATDAGVPADGGAQGDASTVDAASTLDAGPAGNAVCGNGVRTGPEQCDDGNRVNRDGCSSTCTIEYGFSCRNSPSVCASTCGDGLVANNEACDDGNTIDDVTCPGDCRGEFYLSDKLENCDSRCAREGLRCAGAGSVGLDCKVFVSDSQCSSAGYWIYREWTGPSGPTRGCYADWGTSDVCTNNYNLGNAFCCHCAR